MKIDNVIMSVDENEMYMSYWPFISEIWYHLGIHPILIFCTNNISTQFPHSSKYGEVIPVQALKSRTSLYNGTMSRMLAAAAITGTNYITDIDLLPCSREPLDIIENQLTENTIATYSHSKLFVASGIIASSDLFKKIYAASEIFITSSHIFWTEEVVDKLESISNCYNSYEGYFVDYDIYKGFFVDETQFTNCVKKYKKTNYIRVITMNHARFVEAWPFSVRHSATYPTVEEVIAGKSCWSFDGIRNGKIWQLHINHDKDKRLTAYAQNVILESIKGAITNANRKCEKS